MAGSIETPSNAQARAPSARIDVGATEAAPLQGRRLLAYYVLGVLFGIVLIKAEIVSWFRIQEMFRFDAFHMYGVLMSAIAVAGVSIVSIERFGLKTLDGDPIVIPPKTMGSGIRYVVGGLLFGVGWGLTGACPGPLFALVGSGVGVMAVVLLSALAGAWVYGCLRPHLPH
jgi:uncharacterized membrane protein YedE/YeeE